MPDFGFEINIVKYVDIAHTIEWIKEIVKKQNED